MPEKPSDVLLINPPWKKEKGNIWRKVAGVVPPLGLACLAAMAERSGLSVKIIDAQALRLSEEETAEAIGRGSARWIGFTATTPIVNSAYRLARRAASAHPGAKIVFGGPHVTAIPEEPFEHVPSSTVVRGEADVTFQQLITGAPAGEIQGISYLENGVPQHNPARPLISDLDSLPKPAYHLLPLGLYRPSLGNYRLTPALSIIATRGCYGRCTFCYREIFGSEVRSASNENIISQLKYLRTDHGIRDIQFYDDIFLGTRKRIREFCEDMMRERPGVIWVCNLRSELTTPEILTLMKKAGCYMVDYGIESGDPGVLEGMRKNASLERTIECIRMARDAGMDIKCGFMIGSPGETSETLNKTLETAFRIAPDTAMFNITTPFPGTEIFKQAETQGRLLSRDWDLYDYSHVLLGLASIPENEILGFYKTVYRRFYLRPSYILRRLLKLRSREQAAMAARAFFAIFGLVFFERRKSAA